jgi:RNA polymerase sigma-70 factor (ECF subfamily)
MDDADDAGLARLRALDAGAWDDLYHRVHPGLVGVARRRFDNLDEAHDAVAETMSRAVHSIQRYRPRPGVPIDGWLHGILRNVVADRLRRSRRPRRYEPVAVPAAGPETAVLDQEERDAVVAAFDRLSRADQELLELRVVAGLSAEATAAVLGKRPGAVRMAQARALERLRAEMVTT